MLINKFAILVLILCFAPLTWAANDHPDVVPVYYELDTWGSNSDVYEFTPVTIPWKTCLVFLTDSDLRPAMQCFDKADAKVIMLEAYQKSQRERKGGK